MEKSKSYAIWRESNGQKYLEICALDYYTLGLFEGEYLSKKIKEMKILIKILSLKYLPKKFSYKKFKKIAENYEKFIPKYLQSEMLGMADAIKNVSYEDILLQNCFLDLLYGQLIPKDIHNSILHSYDLGCTSFGAINQDSTLIGQNFDFSIIFKPALSFTLLKMPKKPEIFSLRLGSMLSLPAGRNSYGVSIAVNVVKSRVEGFFSIPVSIKSRIALESSKNAESLYNFLISRPNPASGNLLISDNSKIIAMEILPFDHIREDIVRIVVRSNTYISDSFQKYLIKPNYSKKRQKYAETHLNEIYNNKSLTDDKLINLLADEPTICRLKRRKSMTIAFLTKKYFGIGNTKYDEPGIVPIK